MSFGKENDFGTTDICEIARRMCLLPKVNSNKSRVVVITQVSPSWTVQPFYGHARSVLVGQVGPAKWFVGV